VATDRHATLRNAENLLREGKTDLAMAEYARIVEEDPRDWNTANTLGDLYVRENRIDEAVLQYVKAAVAVEDLGFLRKAIAIYKKALKLRPGDGEVWLRVAGVAAGEGLTADARAFADQAAELLQREGVARVAHVRERIAAVEAARKKDKAGPAVLEAEGKEAAPEIPAPVDSSARAVDEPHPAVLSHAPQNAPTLEGALAALREEAAGNSALQEAEADYARGQQLLEMGRDDEAVAALEAAAKSPALRFAAASAAARIHRNASRPLRAIEWFERAAQAPPPAVDQGHELLYELADVLEQVGDIDRALAVSKQLSTQAGEYRDVSARIRRLSGVGSGG
jgi:tetratricopeptide (TPR) repeat protein